MADTEGDEVVLLAVVGDEGEDAGHGGPAYRPGAGEATVYAKINES